ncbi:MAG: hypothetical protein IT212_07850 [Bacteroidia bacterium]|nr:hypothetical protein [Bacteroidia bacterium]
MITEESYLEAKKIIDTYESEQLNKHIVSGALPCWVKDSADNEKILVRESKNGLKYLIFDDELISYGRVGNDIGDYEAIHFDGTNGKSIISAWSNDH